MANDKVLVLGGTGPAGICLLRELIYRKKDAVVYARNPQKIPADLAASPYLDIIKGEMDDEGAISDAVSKCNVVLSLLGPNILRPISPTLFPDQYRRVWAGMRQHNVKRIYAMGTISIVEPKDRFSILGWLMVWAVYLFANSAWHNIINLGKAYETEAQDLDWTIYRVALVRGGDDEQSWRDQRLGELFEGWKAEPGWTGSIRRAELARWLVDAAEGKAAQGWARSKPMVSSKQRGGQIKEL